MSDWHMESVNGRWAPLSSALPISVGLIPEVAARVLRATAQGWIVSAERGIIWGKGRT